MDLNARHVLALYIAIGLALLGPSLHMTMSTPQTASISFNEVIQTTITGTEPSAQQASWDAIGTGSAGVEITAPQQVSFLTQAGVAPDLKAANQQNTGSGPVQNDQLLARELTTSELSARRNRSRLETYASILAITTYDALTISQIALLLRLNFRQTKDLLAVLVANDLLQEHQGSSLTYRATERGTRFSDHIRSALRLLT